MPPHFENEGVFNKNIHGFRNIFEKCPRTEIVGTNWTRDIIEIITHRGFRVF